MKDQNGIRMTYGNLLSTVALAVAFFWGWADVSQATEANAAEIEHAKELAEQDRNNIKESLKRMEKLLEKLAEREA